MLPGGSLRPDWEQPAPGRFGPEDAGYESAMEAHRAAVEAGIDRYRDPLTRMCVFTAPALARRLCCGSLCRHCPWEG